MIARIAASLLALVLLVTTGVTSSTAYVCLMDGQVRSECCCKKADAEAEADRDCAKIERDKRCCEVQVTTAEQPPARSEVVQQHQLSPQTLLASLPVIPQVFPPTGRDVTLLPAARGPPSPTGPPLYIRNCSFLI